MNRSIDKSFAFRFILISKNASLPVGYARLILFQRRLTTRWADDQRSSPIWFSYSVSFHPGVPMVRVGAPIAGEGPSSLVDQNCPRCVSGNANVDADAGFLWQELENLSLHWNYLLQAFYNLIFFKNLGFAT